MKEFINEYYTVLTKLVEIMAAITGLFLLKKYKHTAAKYFIYFLLYVVFIELVGAYTKYLNYFGFLGNIKNVIDKTVFRQNYWWYTIFWSIGSMLFYAFYYHKILKSKVFKKVIKYSAIIFLTISVSIILKDVDGFFVGRPYAITLMGAVIVLLCVLFYFIEMLYSDKILTFYRSFNFYVTVTIFIWWLATVPLSFYQNFFNIEDPDYILLRKVILLSSNILMYSSFTFALIWCRPQTD